MVTERKPAAPRDTDARRPPVSLLQASCWLALILIVAKAVTPDASSFAGFSGRVVTLLISSWTDVLFAIGLGALGEIIVALVRRSHRAATIIRGLFLAVFALCAIYAVAAVGLFRYFHRPLTYELFGLIGNTATIRSSVMERITGAIAVAFLAAPGIFLALAFLIRASRLKIALALVLLGAWCATGWSLHRAQPRDKELTHLWLSPHVELLRTTGVRLTGGRRPGFPKDFPPEYVDEFRTFAGRGATARSHFELPAGVPRPRNLIVVVLESVGTKYLGLYGNPRDITPTLTAEAQHALVFDNIYAHASFTYASFRPINFSVYPGLPWHYAVVDYARPRPKPLASLLRERGARTAYFTSGDLDWGDQRWLLERESGFGLVQGAADLGCPLLSSWGTEDRCLVDRLLKWIDEKPNEPFFAVCWTDQTHDPFLLSPGTKAEEVFQGNTPPAFAADFTRYLNLVRNVDAQLARIFSALRERGLADDTLVVVTGDHGEAFGDPHGQRGHAWSVYEEEVHVPLMLWNPRLFPGGSRASTIGGHVDLNPTLADLLDLPADGEWQGHSLFDPARPPRAYFLAIAGGDIFGVREGDWKYVYDVANGRESLFNLRLDPEEQHDFAAGEPARAAQLRQRVAAWVTFEDAFLKGREN